MFNIREDMLNKLPEDVQVKIDELMEKGWRLEITTNNTYGMVDFLPPDIEQTHLNYRNVICLFFEKVGMFKLKFLGPEDCLSLNDLFEKDMLNGETFEKYLNKSWEKLKSGD